MTTIAVPTNLIQSAIKAKAPVCGISIPGHAPFRVLRSLLRDSLKGLKIVSATYEPGDHARKLRVEAVGHKVRATRTYFPLDKQTASNLLDKWIKAERLKGSKAARAVKLSPTEKKLAELRAKLAKMTRKPRNPCLAAGYSVPDYRRDLFYRWHLEKQLRRTYRSKGDFQMAVLTGALNAEMSNPCQHYYYSDMPTWGPHRYASYLDEDRQAIKAQIAVLLDKLGERVECKLSKAKGTVLAQSTNEYGTGYRVRWDAGVTTIAAATDVQAAY